MIKQRGKKGIYCYYGYFNGKQYVESLKTTDKDEARYKAAKLDLKYADPNSQPLKKKNPEWETFWKEFSEWQEKHRRKRTAEAKKRAWDMLTDFAKPPRLANVTAKTIEEWKASMTVESVSVNSYVKEIKSIFSWARKNGYAAVDLSTVERLPETPKEPPEPLTKEQFDKLLAHCKKQLRTFVLLCGLCGLRKGEASNLEWSNIKDNHIALRADQSKTGKARLVPLPERVKEALDATPRKNPYIFQPARISEAKTAYRYDPKKSLAIALKAAGLPKDEPFQRLRCTYIRFCYDAGVGVADCCKYSGNSIPVVMRYYVANRTADPRLINL